MGVNHLNRDAAAAQSGRFSGSPSESEGSMSFNLGPDGKSPSATSASNSVPLVAGVQRESRSELHGDEMGAPKAPNGTSLSGGRLGAKSGQSKVGGPAPRPGVSGGSMG